MQPWKEPCGEVLRTYLLYTLEGGGKKKKMARLGRGLTRGLVEKDIMDRGGDMLWFSRKRVLTVEKGEGCRGIRGRG